MIANPPFDTSGEPRPAWRMRAMLAAGALLVFCLGAALGTIRGGRPESTSIATPSLDPSPARRSAPMQMVVAEPTIPPAAAAPPDQPPPLAPPADVAVAVAVPELIPAPPPTVDERAIPVGATEQDRGESLFRKTWTANDPACPTGNGLGPVFNATSCVACHDRGGAGGSGPADRNIILLTSVARMGPNLPEMGLMDGSMDKVHPAFADGVVSFIFHHEGTDPAYAPWRTRFLAAHRYRGDTGAWLADHRVPDRPAYLDAGADRAMRITQRNPPALFGAGLIDAIPAAIIVRGATQGPHPVRGRPSRLGSDRLGRFGWKGQAPDILDFVRRSAGNELGLSVPDRREAASPLATAADSGGVDLRSQDCAAMAAYIRALPAPMVIDPWGPLGSWRMAEGRRLFAQIGCAACHVPTLGPVAGLYSDLLLHDLGPGLAERGNYAEADDHCSDLQPGEWRTPPLWGFRDSAPYMHDGRAADLAAAVGSHGGQAYRSARHFFALDAEERGWVEAFLNSLVAPPASPTPGIIPAADLEARPIADEVRRAAPATNPQRQRDVAATRDEEATRRAAVERAGKLARSRLVMATNLEKAGKGVGAVEFYRAILREAPATPEAEQAAARLAALATPAAP